MPATGRFPEHQAVREKQGNQLRIHILLTHWNLKIQTFSNLKQCFLGKYSLKVIQVCIYLFRSVLFFFFFKLVRKPVISYQKCLQSQWRSCRAPGHVENPLFGQEEHLGLMTSELGSHGLSQCGLWAVTPRWLPTENPPDRTWPLLWGNMLVFSNNGWWMPGIICAVTTVGICRMEASTHSVNNHVFSTNWLLERPRECRKASAVFAPSQGSICKDRDK